MKTDMDKEEFLSELKQKLAEDMSAADIAEQLRYYSDYIDREVGRGLSETEVLEQLGNPNLLARTILDASKKAGREGFRTQSPGSDAAEMKGSRQIKEISGARWGCGVVLLVVILAVGILLWLVGSIFRILAPILVPLLLAVILWRLFRKTEL